MDRNQICEGIKEIIDATLKGEVDLSNVSEDVNLVDEIGINSIIGIEILVRTESFFDICIDDEDLELELISNIATLADYVEKKLEG
ncbi:MAG TPA: acyl carrier protein [Mobilitalea sp.]|nr:acyl carrier protein [Mobilitalea sp.]